MLARAVHPLSWPASLNSTMGRILGWGGGSGRSGKMPERQGKVKTWEPAEAAESRRVDRRYVDAVKVMGTYGVADPAGPPRLETR